MKDKNLLKTATEVCSIMEQVETLIKNNPEYTGELVRVKHLLEEADGLLYHCWEE
tara:strand:- start:593 stop:757 length:165 start_codon:yes stop_codon:yes gene_type:complete